MYTGSACPVPRRPHTAVTAALLLVTMASPSFSALALTLLSFLPFLASVLSRLTFVSSNEAISYGRVIMIMMIGSLSGNLGS